MASHVPSSGRRPFAGQVVRPPSPTEGVGRALRHVYGQEGELPSDWDAYLRSLENLREQ